MWSNLLQDAQNRRLMKDVRTRSMSDGDLWSLVAKRRMSGQEIEVVETCGPYGETTGLCGC